MKHEKVGVMWKNTHMERVENIRAGKISPLM